MNKFGKSLFCQCSSFDRIIHTVTLQFHCNDKDLGHYSPLCGGYLETRLFMQVMVQGYEIKKIKCEV